MKNEIIYLDLNKRTSLNCLSASNLSPTFTGKLYSPTRMARFYGPIPLLLILNLFWFESSRSRVPTSAGLKKRNQYLDSQTASFYLQANVE